MNNTTKLLGESMLLELERHCCSKDKIVALIDYSLNEIVANQIKVSDDIIDGLHRLKRKYKLLYPEYLPNRESFAFSQSCQSELLDALEELTNNKPILDSNKTIEAIEANFEQERIALGLPKKSFRQRLKIAFVNYTTRL